MIYTVVGMIPVIQSGYKQIVIRNVWFKNVPLYKKEFILYGVGRKIHDPQFRVKNTHNPQVLVKNTHNPQFPVKNIHRCQQSVNDFE